MGGATGDYGLKVAFVVLAAISITTASLDWVGVGAQVHPVDDGGDDRAGWDPSNSDLASSSSSDKTTFRVGDNMWGWDPSSDLASWSSGKTFLVGDNIWLAYSAAHGYIAEVKSKEEFESCDVSNPIRMFTDGLDSISMDQEGLRYFASSNIESCKNGLKLHVQVMPHPQSHQNPDDDNDMSAKPKPNMVKSAYGPSTPSGSAHLDASLMLLSFGLLCYVIGILE